MSKERLLETLGQVREEFIEEAAPKGLLDNSDKATEPVKKSGRITKIYPYLKWGSLAACLCIIVGLGMRILLFSAAENDMAIDNALSMDSVTQGESNNTKAEAPKQDMETKTDGMRDYYTFNDKTKEDGSEETEEAATAPGHGDEGFPDWGLTLSVENVTSTGLTLVVTQSGGNPTGEFLMTGEPYRLFTLVDGTWEVVEELPLPEGVDGRAWNSIGYPISKGETREFEINWEWMFGELPSGTYRLIKNFMDFRETANYDSADFWVEFEIK